MNNMRRFNPKTNKWGWKCYNNQNHSWEKSYEEKIVKDHKILIKHFRCVKCGETQTIVPRIFYRLQNKENKNGKKII